MPASSTWEEIHTEAVIMKRRKRWKLCRENKLKKMYS
jgi:hypothetical protein